MYILEHKSSGWAYVNKVGGKQMTFRFGVLCQYLQVAELEHEDRSAIYTVGSKGTETLPHTAVGAVESGRAISCGRVLQTITC